MPRLTVTSPQKRLTLISILVAFVFYRHSRHNAGSRSGGGDIADGASLAAFRLSLGRLLNSGRAGLAYGQAICACSS